MSAPEARAGIVSVVDEWVLGPGDAPFFTRQWFPSDDEPKAYIIFMHGFAEHVARYDRFFRLLAAAPSSLHITAFDQRGHGRTAHAPLAPDSPEVRRWREEGKTVKTAKSTKRRTGGWARVMPDVEWFVQRESERSQEKGKKLFLWGFSMGGAQALAFPTRPHPPPSKKTLSLLSGVIAGGALVRQTKAAPWVQVKAGTLAASLGLGNMLIPAPLDYDHLSHNKESNEANRSDPFCEQVGSLRGIADMLNGGISLDTPAAWEAWPKDLPLLAYHGEEDPICDVKAVERFMEKVVAKDKTFELIKGMYHEVHNELEPVPTDLAKTISAWIHARLGAPVDAPPTSVAPSEGANGVAKL